MSDKDIYELMFLVKSSKNNMQRKYKNKFKDQVEETCLKYCNKHNINITHGSAYKEVCHKYYYYIDKYICNLISKRQDLYDLRKNHIISDKEILDKLLNK